MTGRKEDIDKSNVPWGARWEIARHITSLGLQWDELAIQQLLELTGSSLEAAPKVPSVFSSGVPKQRLGQRERDPWRELDLEEKFGPEGTYDNAGALNGWYGGKVCQRIGRHARI